MRKLLLFVFALLALPALAAEVLPIYKLVVQVSESDPARWNLTLNNVKNAQKDMGASLAEVEIVAFGPGLDMLKDDSEVGARIQEALSRGVKVLACRNTMGAMKLKEADLQPNIGFVPAGVVEIIQKQAQGYSYLRP